MRRYDAAMRLRWKMTLLLLAIALTPVLLVATISRFKARQVLVQVGDNARDELIGSARQQLSEIASGSARVLDAQRQLFEVLIGIQRFGVERVLSAEPPEPSGPIYDDTDFEQDPSPVPGLMLSDKHPAVDDAGRVQPMRVSYEHPAFRLSPGVSRDHVGGQMQRLAAMDTAFRKIHEKHGPLLLWQYVATADGVFVTYPGKGGYPEDYDPRQRPWYQWTVTSVTQNPELANQPLWHLPVVDVTTRQITIPVTMAVTDEAGEVIAVTGIDVLLSDLLGDPKLPAEWRAGADVMLVLLPRDEGWATTHGVAVDKPVVITRRSDIEGQFDWRTPAKLVYLDSTDGAAMTRLIDDMTNDRGGVLRMPYDGQDRLWAYQPMGTRGTFLVITVPAEHVVKAATRAEEAVISEAVALLRNTGLVLGAAVVLVIVVAFVMAKRLTMPVDKLAAAAERIAAGDLEARADVTRRDEIGKLAQAFNVMVPKLQDRLRMRQALSLAMDVQQNLLPQGPPNVPGLDIAGHSIYCDETGGDYYDFIDFGELGDDRLGIALGDVTGHGIAAALLMCAARALLRSHADEPEEVPRLAEAFTAINQHLNGGEFAGRFMTLFYLVISADRRRVRYISAGHDPAIVYDPVGDAFEEWEGRDIPLGVQPGWEFSEVTQSADYTGRIVVLATDGVWEARNPAGEQWGKENLRQVIRAHAAEPAERIAQAITDAVHAYRAGGAQEDDITLVVVRFT